MLSDSNFEPDDEEKGVSNSSHIPMFAMEIVVMSTLVIILFAIALFAIPTFTMATFAMKISANGSIGTQKHWQ